MTSILVADFAVDASVYGPFGPSGSNPDTVVREVSFGPAVSLGGPNHFAIQNILVGTAGFGSSDLFAPPLSSLADFDMFFGAGSDPTFSGGIMLFDNTDDRYGVFAFPSDLTEIWVQFDLNVYPDDNEPDYHDISPVADGDLSTFTTGIFNGGGVWATDGPPTVNFGVGPIKDGVTFQTIGCHWKFVQPAAPIVFDGQQAFRAGA